VRRSPTSSPAPPMGGRRQRPLIRRRPPRATVPWHRRLRHRPAGVVPWLVAGGLAALAGLAIGQMASAADDARTQWGDTRAVLVVTRPLDAGDRLAGATARMDRPRAVLPEGALTSLPPNARAGRTLVRGETLVRTAVSARALDGFGGTGPEGGRRIVAVSQAQAQLPLRVGHRVDVWSTLDPSVAGAGGATTSRVARDAEVVDVDRDTVALAVAIADTPGVAEASALGAVTLVGVPGGSGPDP